MHRLKEYWLTILDDETKTTNMWWDRKRKLFKERQADIVRINGAGRLFHSLRSKDNHNYQYLLHLSLLIKQNEMFYIEEQVIPHQFQIERGEIIEHRDIVYPNQNEDKETSQFFEEQMPQSRFVYDRLAAVQYAERWWNSYNPEFRKFDVDCTNFVSQCLFAGGIPMNGYPDRQKGWWYQNDNWSFSWSVSHSLRWHLSGSTAGLQGKEVGTAEELKLGDVICYDFEGDGRYDHSTIVVAKDNYGQPLVNAHTDNSRHRYWSYEDSTAWTPNIKYKFFQIGEK